MTALTLIKSLSGAQMLNPNLKRSSTEIKMTSIKHNQVLSVKTGTVLKDPFCYLGFKRDEATKSIKSEQSSHNSMNSI